MKKLTMILLAFAISMYTNATSLNYNDDTSLFSFMKDWIGVKYKRGGTTKAGVDCSGFSTVLYQQIYNEKLPRTASQQYKATKRIKKDSLLTGDLVFFRTRSRSGWHVGVYLGDSQFIHSENRRTGVKISSLDSKYYRSTYLGGGRLPQDTITRPILYNQFRDYVEWLQEHEK